MAKEALWYLAQLLISLCIIDTIFLVSNVMTAREAFGFKGKKKLAGHPRANVINKF